MSDISRRDLLRAAGGATFLALIPTGRLTFPFALPAAAPDPPLLFTALPDIVSQVREVGSPQARSRW